ncbi:hypothetical protein GCM10009551_001200 [Nocardiopsis tropica]
MPGRALHAVSGWVRSGWVLLLVVAAQADAVAVEDVAVFAVAVPVDEVDLVGPVVGAHGVS